MSIVIDIKQAFMPERSKKFQVTQGAEGSNKEKHACIISRRLHCVVWVAVFTKVGFAVI